MTKLQAMKEAALRAGDKASDIDAVFSVIMAIGGKAAFDLDKELKPGTEEEFIQRQTEIKKQVEKHFVDDPDEAHERAMRAARYIFQKRGDEPI